MVIVFQPRACNQAERLEVAVCSRRLQTEALVALFNQLGSAGKTCGAVPATLHIGRGERFDVIQVVLPGCLTGKNTDGREKKRQKAGDSAGLCRPIEKSGRTRRVGPNRK